MRCRPDGGVDGDGARCGRRRSTRRPIASATEAYRQGIAALKSGDTETALPALEYAADRGVLGAQLKLARIYAAGNGTERDDAKAYIYYRQIANQRADISPSSPVAKYVAEAFVSLGNYYLQGIPDAQVRAEPGSRGRPVPPCRELFRQRRRAIRSRACSISTASASIRTRVSP